MAPKKRKYAKITDRKENAPKKIKFTITAPEAQNVFLVGNFNNWSLDSHPLKKNIKGEWGVGIDLTPGRYEYRFLVDGEWQNDPNCATCTPNSFGSENCVLILKK